MRSLTLRRYPRGGSRQEDCTKYGKVEPTFICIRDIYLVTCTCNGYYKTNRICPLAFAGLQPALEENQRASWDMAETPEVRNYLTSELRLCITQYAGEPGAL